MHMDRDFVSLSFYVINISIANKRGREFNFFCHWMCICMNQLQVESVLEADELQSIKMRIWNFFLSTQAGRQIHDWWWWCTSRDKLIQRCKNFLSFSQLSYMHLILHFFSIWFACETDERTKMASISAIISHWAVQIIGSKDFLSALPSFSRWRYCTIR